MKLGKIFICINILVLSLLMLTGWPRIIYQNTSYRFDEYNRTIVLDDDGDIIETENGYDIIKEQYYKEIDNSIANTTIHTYAGVAEYVCGVRDKELREIMLDRINFMLSIAEEHGVQTLILGAWGCGIQKLWRNYLWR